ncbi:hypothetical protein CYMTET_19360 [Cymbomonas tetramitiformis]|uniref:Uncharacterized protein n=1 Tax=Cymbomonas tetramitiformis TaxID=36881 RepID=A0AAE0G6S0_9CHLO|nr:hypothetical protein CYMTET_19360 [Cymbomonas tetramitiformis]
MNKRTCPVSSDNSGVVKTPRVDRYAAASSAKVVNESEEFEGRDLVTPEGWTLIATQRHIDDGGIRCKLANRSSRKHIYEQVNTDSEPFSDSGNDIFAVASLSDNEDSETSEEFFKLQKDVSQFEQTEKQVEKHLIESDEKQDSFEAELTARIAMLSGGDKTGITTIRSKRIAVRMGESVSDLQKYAELFHSWRDKRLAKILDWKTEDESCYSAKVEIEDCDELWILILGPDNVAQSDTKPREDDCSEFKKREVRMISANIGIWTPIQTAAAILSSGTWKTVKYVSQLTGRYRWNINTMPPTIRARINGEGQVMKILSCLQPRCDNSVGQHDKQDTD